MGVSTVTGRVSRMWFPGIDNNAFLISAGSETTLVDVGPPKGMNLVTKGVGRRGTDLRDVRHVVLTHCHTDHTGNLAAVLARAGATVYGHAADAGIVRDGAERPRGRPSRRMGRIMLRMAKGSSRADPAPVHVEGTDDWEIRGEGRGRARPAPGAGGGDGRGGEGGGGRHAVPPHAGSPRGARVLPVAGRRRRLVRRRRRHENVPPAGCCPDQRGRRTCAVELRP